MSYPAGFEPVPEPEDADRTWKYPPDAEPNGGKINQPNNTEEQDS